MNRVGHSPLPHSSQKTSAGLCRLPSPTILAHSTVVTLPLRGPQSQVRFSLFREATLLPFGKVVQFYRLKGMSTIGAFMVANRQVVTVVNGHPIPATFRTPPLDIPYYPCDSGLLSPFLLAPRQVHLRHIVKRITAHRNCGKLSRNLSVGRFLRRRTVPAVVLRAFCSSLTPATSATNTEYTLQSQM